MVNWIALLTAYRVDFHQEKDNLYVHCPWCGTADQGQHMGISLKGKGWGCWRNTRHRGKNQARLLSALLLISYYQAQQLLGETPNSSSSDQDLSARVRSALEPALAKPTPITLPKEIKPLTGRSTGHQAIFTEYLRDRGYREKHILLLCKRYRLHYCTQGIFNYRLVIPIYNHQGELVTWTGRTVAEDVELRYLTLSTTPGKMEERGLPLARGPINDFLFQERVLFRDPVRTLVLCEGPFDAMRVDFACEGMSVHGTCLFGKAISDQQLDTLAELSEFYDDRILLLDSDAGLDQFQLLAQLASFRPLRLPSRWKDPGEMPLDKIRELLT